MHTPPPIFSGIRNAMILLLWGTGVFWLAGSGRLSTYLHPSLQPFTVAAGCLLILLAGFAIMVLATMRGGSAASCACDHGHDHHGHDYRNEEHGHHHGEGVMGLLLKTLILLIPVGVFLSGQADRFTATTVKNRGVVQDFEKLPSAAAAAMNAASKAAETSPETTTSTSEKPVGPMPLQIIDMLYAIQMPSYRGEFEGKLVEMIGQFVPMSTGNPKGDRFQAVRMFMTCCAADAKPLGVIVQFPKLPLVPEMGWVKITGKPTFPVEGGRRTAILDATKVEPCPAPSDPFVY